MSTFAEYLEKWLKQSTAHGLTNPLLKMPVKRFRLLQPDEFTAISTGGSLILGTNADPIARNLHKNYLTRIRERGEHSAYLSSGAVEMIVAGTVDGKQRKQLFPVCLKRAAFQTSGDKIKVVISDDEVWQFNPVLQSHLRSFSIPSLPTSVLDNPDKATKWIKSQLGNRASQITTDSYIGLFSSQQMVVQNRLTEFPLRQALAKNPVIQAKIAGTKVGSVAAGELTDDGMEDLGLALPCDDSQLRVVQLTHGGHSLQVEGPPGTGKSQTIANIISNALYHGRKVLLVCDKKAAIIQVEERLANAGLKPAMLNLHDEDLDKREFLKQATDKFPAKHSARIYPFTQLKEARATLNDRVRFGRGVAHPSLQVSKREALAGLIQLKKELGNVPKISIANWQSLSKERLTKLIGCLAEWPNLANVLTDDKCVWNQATVEAFDDNPNATNEIQNAINKLLEQIDSLQIVKEWAATVGMEMPLGSEANVTDVLVLVKTVLEKPSCHNFLIGNKGVSYFEVSQLKLQWNRRVEILAEQHPVNLTDKANDEAVLLSIAKTEETAKELLRVEGAKTWADLTVRQSEHSAHQNKIESNQKNYQRLCEQIGLVYSPLITVRRAQLHAIIALAVQGVAIPRSWWKPDATPVLSVANWRAHFQACATQANSSPLPIHFVALESFSETHWQYIEAKAEHGFNLVSYWLHFVDDRKCKYALRQVYPSIPSRGFKLWQEVTLHAVGALRSVKSLRAVAENHVILKQITAAFLAEAYENQNQVETYLNSDKVSALDRSASIVEQLRDRNDLFAIDSAHWQAFWESNNASLMGSVNSLLSELDNLRLPPDQQSDNLEDAICFYRAASERIGSFLTETEQQDGCRTNSVMAAFSAQREFGDCIRKLVPLQKYQDIQPFGETQPDWDILLAAVAWRDLFEKLRGQQNLDIDSALWSKIRFRLELHKQTTQSFFDELNSLFEFPSVSDLDYSSLLLVVKEILEELPRCPLWLEKKRWQGKISVFPEIKSLWGKVIDGTVEAEHVERLFCFNLLRLCDPLAKPHGPQFKQTLREFAEQDEKLASWIIDHLKENLRDKMDAAAKKSPANQQSESELRRLAGLQRVRGTVRELVNANIGYLVEAKSCWLMSPTSLANLIDSKIFEDHGVPFDLCKRRLKSAAGGARKVRHLPGQRELFSLAFVKPMDCVAR